MNKEQPTETTVKWKCAICGYIYEGETPFENLPSTWTCPKCHNPKVCFEKTI
ncbi:MAG: rubredoxin [Lachnospiraceae bacterium]|jgi:rubredoxin|nr:rubredoxin [Lachnospiraceae bacterium]